MSLSIFFKLAAAIAVSQAAGIIGSFYTVPSIKSGWYADLVKPELAPPNWIFAPVWTTLFLLMGISLFIVWQKHSQILENLRMLRVWRWAMTFFFIQLVLNTLWSIIFFGFQNPAVAFVEIIFLWLAIVATIIAFAKISKPAAWLLVPYLMWVSFAACLNYWFWILNA